MTVKVISAVDVDVVAVRFGAVVVPTATAFASSAPEVMTPLNS